ncbi:MAG: DNA replication and repair protein RecF [Pseudomonadota bacterium]
MIIKTINIKNFRNHENLSLNLQKGVNFFWGLNGIGKTNIIEAVYYNFHQTSFRTKNKDHLIKEGRDGFDIEVHANHSFGDTQYNSIFNGKQKKFLINGNIERSITNSIKNTPIVLSAPNDFWTIKGSPQERRNFIDSALSRLDNIYLKDLLIYKKIVKNRNAVLIRIYQRSCSFDEIYIWNEQLFTYSSKLLEKRLKYVELLNLNLNEILLKYYDDLKINVNYYENKEFDFNYWENKEAFKLLFDKLKEKEVIRQKSLIGPHRDDIIFIRNNKEARFFTSQGETKELAVLLKLAELYILRNNFNNKPIFLWDDLGAELDIIKRDRLSSILADLDIQVLCTTTEIDTYKKNKFSSKFAFLQVT